MDNAIMRLPEVVAKVSIPKSTLYKWIRKGMFPRPVLLGIRSVGWHSRDVNAWVESRQQR